MAQGNGGALRTLQFLTLADMAIVSYGDWSRSMLPSPSQFALIGLLYIGLARLAETRYGWTAPGFMGLLTIAAFQGAQQKGTGDLIDTVTGKKQQKGPVIAA